MPETVALVRVRQVKNVNLRRRFVFTVAAKGLGLAGVWVFEKLQLNLFTDVH